MESLALQTNRPWFLATGDQKAASLFLAICLVVIFAAADWYIGLDVSLGVLYVIPILIFGSVLSRRWVVAAALLCAVVRIAFGQDNTLLKTCLSFALASAGYAGTGFYISELVRNRKLLVKHTEEMEKQHALRREAEEQLRILAESSPAAIMTLDARGEIRAANDAARDLLAFESRDALIGASISPYLPVLADALRLDTGSSEFRTAAQCPGKRSNGEMFMAHTWFSTYASSGGRRLAAIAVDSSEEVRDREEENLRQLLRSNHILATAVSHDVRNLCSAITIIYANLKRANACRSSEDFAALGSLVDALGGIASLELKSQTREGLPGIDLRGILDQLRIIIEPSWNEIDGQTRWRIAEPLPYVVADSSGLLQVFLNLAQNSHRAVKAVAKRVLTVETLFEPGKIIVNFVDSGPGVSDPGRLFQPFQSGSESTGIGLYMSRAVLRTFGGDLSHVPGAEGCCFAVKLKTVEAR